MILSFTKDHCNPPLLTVDQSLIGRVDRWKCLGITISSSLSWTHHFNNVISKGQSKLYLIRCVVSSSGLSRADLVFLIESLLVPVLCYAYIPLLVKH